MTGLNKAISLIRNAKSIAISGHVNPDGDSIGSLLALGLGLEKMGKRVFMISCDGVPRRYRALSGAKKIRRKLVSNVDLAITVDCCNQGILGKTYDSFKRSKELLEIDHHDFRRPYGTAALIDCNAAAVGEMVYMLLKGLRVSISRDIAENIMTSIIVETNSFSLPNIRPLTFRICSDLLSKGVDFYRLVDTIFWSKTRQASLLTGICLSRCAFRRGGRIVWSIVRKSDFDKIGGSDEDVDPVPDEMRAIAGVRVAALLREHRGGILRVSLRSKGSVNVASIAELYGGGGHFDVAGCSIDDSPESIKKFLHKVDTLL